MPDWTKVLRTGGARRAAAVAFGVTLVLPASTAAGAPSPVVRAPKVTCKASAPDRDAAVASAVRCGSEVKVEASLTEWNTLTALPDGSMRLDASVEAVRARQGKTWVDVDNSVVAADGALRVAAAVAPMTFSDGSGDEPLARIVRDGHELTFDAPFDLPEPSVEANQITYDEVLPGVDLIVTVNADATGFSEVLRVVT